MTWTVEKSTKNGVAIFGPKLLLHQMYSKVAHTIFHNTVHVPNFVLIGSQDSA